MKLQVNIPYTLPVWQHLIYSNSSSLTQPDPVTLPWGQIGSCPGSISHGPESGHCEEMWIESSWKLITVTKTDHRSKYVDRHNCDRTFIPGHRVKGHPTPVLRCSTPYGMCHPLERTHNHTCQSGCRWIHHRIPLPSIRIMTTNEADLD